MFILKSLYLEARGKQKHFYPLRLKKSSVYSVTYYLDQKVKHVCKYIIMSFECQRDFFQTHCTTKAEGPCVCVCVCVCVCAQSCPTNGL